MLSAKEARKIAGSELLQIMNLIRNQAYDGGLVLKLDYSITEATVKVLKDYGYEVKIGDNITFDETPYGKILKDTVKHRVQTIISWN